MTIRLVTLATALVGLCTFTFAVSPPPASALKLSATAVHVYVPKIPAGTPVSGNCWTTSIATSRPGAYRCMAGNSISDPCFATMKASIVVCDPDPARGKPGFAMRVTGSLPAPLHLKGPAPAWLVQFHDGMTCQPLTGTRDLVGKVLIAYGCTPAKNQKPNTYVGLADPLDSKSSVWFARRVVYRSGSNGPELVSSERVPIVAVWR